MREIKCPICGTEMKLEETRSYYGDYDWDWICQNPNCNYSEE